MLSTVYRQNTKDNIPDFIYKITHKNHPCTLWIAKCFENWQYTLKVSETLYNEYQYRYNKPDKHTKALQIINYLKMCNIDLPKFNKMTSFALAIPEKYKQDDPIISYRQYYLGEKQHLFKWSKRNKPNWINI